ncbi:radical SAM protein [Thermodesulfobacteriota bacterium]
MKQINKLVLVVNESCNLSCGYCYARLSENSRTTQMMSPDIARKIIRDFLFDYDKCNLIQFFGGEPTLNLDSVEAVIEETLEMVADGSLSERPRFAIVTNGVFKDFSRTINLFKKYKMETTVSLDGPESIQNSLRADASGAPTYNRVIETLNTLTKENIPIALETVYTAHHIREEFSLVDLFKFSQELGVSKLIFDSAYPPAPDELNPLSKPYLERTVGYYEDAIDWWFKALIEGKGGSLDVYFKDLLLPLLDGLPAAVADGGCPAGARDFAIGPNGDIFVCQLLYGYPDYKVGNILENDFSDKTAKYPVGSNDIDSCKKCFARYWCQPCAALNLYWGDAWRPPARECRLRKAVISRIGALAFEYLEVPDNEITRVLRDKVTNAER